MDSAKGNKYTFCSLSSSLNCPFFFGMQKFASNSVYKFNANESLDFGVKGERSFFTRFSSKITNRILNF